MLRRNSLPHIVKTRSELPAVVTQKINIQEINNGTVYMRQNFPEFIPSSTFDRVETERLSWSHFSITRRLWEYLIFTISLLTPIEVSYVFIFDSNINLIRYIPFFLFDSIMLFDNIVILITPFLFSGILVSNIKSILRQYGYFKYAFHVFTTLPLAWIGILKNSWKLYLVLSLNKFCRFIHCYKSYRMIRDSTVYRGSLSQLFPIFILLVFIIHFYACVFYLASRINGEGETSWISTYEEKNYSPFQLYIVSVYFVSTSILSIGYGDIHPLTTIEVIICCFIVISGDAFKSSVLAKFVSSLADPYGNKFLAQYNSLRHFMRIKGIPSECQKQIEHYFTDLWERNHGAPSWNQLLSHVPESIRSCIKLEFCKRIFSGMPLFTSLDEKYLLMLINKMEPFTYLPNDIITRQDDEDSCMNVFTYGIIELILNDVPLAILDVCTGYVDGERQLMFKKLQDKTIRAKSYVDGWRLNRSSFIELINSKKTMRRILLSNARSRFPKDFLHSNEWNDEMLFDDNEIEVSDVDIDDVGLGLDVSSSSELIYLDSSDSSHGAIFGDADI